jgi:hypothetical protein
LVLCWQERAAGIDVYDVAAAASFGASLLLGAAFTTYAISGDEEV